jgi:hypothetical protein
MKLDLLTNATVVDDAIRFVSTRSNEKLKLSNNSTEYDKEESNEPDSDQDRDQLEGKQEEEEIDEVTTNDFLNLYFGKSSDFVTYKS